MRRHRKRQRACKLESNVQLDGLAVDAVAPDPRTGACACSPPTRRRPDIDTYEPRHAALAESVLVERDDMIDAPQRRSPP